MTRQNCLDITVAWVLAFGACGRVHDSGTQGGAGTSGRKNGVVVGGDAGSAEVGWQAVAKLEPVVGAVAGAQVGDAGATLPIMGTATFSQRGEGMNLTTTILGCVLRTFYDVFILDGTDCEPATLTGPHWDAPRGEGLSHVSCNGTHGGGRAYYTRASTDAKPWTIDGPPASDVVGHAIAVYAAGDSTHALACGVIKLGDLPQAVSRDAGVGDVPPPSVELRAELGGLCLSKMFVRSNTQECPDPVQYEACVSANCDLAACVTKCARYTTCLAAEPTSCSTGCTSEIEEPCAACMNDLISCALGFCFDVVACAAPIAPDGPCAKLEACCGMQGDAAESCLDTVHLLEKISGDPSCVGVMSDWDTTSHLPVPCNFL